MIGIFDGDVFGAGDKISTGPSSGSGVNRGNVRIFAGEGSAGCSSGTGADRGIVRIFLGGVSSRAVAVLTGSGIGGAVAFFITGDSGLGVTAGAGGFVTTLSGAAGSVVDLREITVVSTGTPQFSQNFASGRRGAPHLRQTGRGSIFVPQFSQNWLSGNRGLSQFGQRGCAALSGGCSFTGTLQTYMRKLYRQTITVSINVVHYRYSSCSIIVAI